MEADAPGELLTSSGRRLEKPAFDGRGFANPPSFTTYAGVPSILQVLRYKLFEVDHSEVPRDQQILERELPVVRPTFPSKSALAATWLGHATVLVHLDGVNFITDPVWSARASPFSFWGPFRYRPPPCPIEDLPELAFGAISHNHYDHLDVAAVQKLCERFPQMKWWQQHTMVCHGKTVEVWCMPAQHWSMRTMFDRNKSLWCGWAVIGPTKRFYYTGDTGFCEDVFRKIGAILGPFDLAAIPIGCYKPAQVTLPQTVGQK